MMERGCKAVSSYVGSGVLGGLLGGLMLISPSHAQECVDSDGDGWGWNGSSSCLVTSDTPVQSNTAACIDNDGDGFGWNGTETCLVGASGSPAPGADNSVGTGTVSTGGSGNACVDIDGDGWGWNGFESCRVNDGTSTGNSPVNPVSEPNPSVPVQIGNGNFNRQRDLVAMHFDHAPDRDDGHAVVAALMVRDALGLNVQVVAGAYGVHNRDRYDSASEQVMASVWGSEWLNAHRDREGSVSAAVNRWTSILAAGGDVWVAEGGQSDFTAAVVRRINANHTEFNTRQRIHVIQHSDWNEVHSEQSDLAYSRNNTRYVKIQDGNNPNATADLRFESHNNGDFVARALASRYSSEWGVAFNYLSPSDKLDFSDAVELLHIVGIGTNEIGDVNDFGDRFF